MQDEGGALLGQGAGLASGPADLQWDSGPRRSTFPHHPSSQPHRAPGHQPSATELHSAAPPGRPRYVLGLPGQPQGADSPAPGATGWDWSGPFTGAAGPQSGEPPAPGASIGLAAHACRVRSESGLNRGASHVKLEEDAGPLAGPHFEHQSAPLGRAPAHKERRMAHAHYAPPTWPPCDGMSDAFDGAADSAANEGCEHANSLPKLRRMAYATYSGSAAEAAPQAAQGPYESGATALEQWQQQQHRLLAHGASCPPTTSGAFHGSLHAPVPQLSGPSAQADPPGEGGSGAALLDRMWPPDAGSGPLHRLQSSSNALAGLSQVPAAGAQLQDAKSEPLPALRARLTSMFSSLSASAAAGDGATDEGPNSVASLPDAMASPFDSSSGPPLPQPVRVQVASRSRRKAAEDDGSCSVTRGAMGTFHPRMYLTGGDCIECNGEMMSRGRFERLAGTATAKWHVSIKVLPSGATLGRWLQQHGLPVMQGKPRKSKRRATRLSGRDGDADADEDGDEDAEGPQDSAMLPGDVSSGALPEPLPALGPSAAAASGWGRLGGVGGGASSGPLPLRLNYTAMAGGFAYRAAAASETGEALSARLSAEALRAAGVVLTAPEAGDDPLLLLLGDSGVLDHVAVADGRSAPLPSLGGRDGRRGSARDSCTGQWEAGRGPVTSGGGGVRGRAGRDVEPGGGGPWPFGSAALQRSRTSGLPSDCAPFLGFSALSVGGSSAAASACGASSRLLNSASGTVSAAACEAAHAIAAQYGIDYSGAAGPAAARPQPGNAQAGPDALARRSSAQANPALPSEDLSLGARWGQDVDMAAPATAGEWARAAVASWGGQAQQQTDGSGAGHLHGGAAGLHNPGGNVQWGQGAQQQKLQLWPEQASAQQQPAARMLLLPADRLPHQPVSVSSLQPPAGQHGAFADSWQQLQADAHARQEAASAQRGLLQQMQAQQASPLLPPAALSSWEERAAAFMRPRQPPGQ